MCVKIIGRSSVLELSTSTSTFANSADVIKEKRLTDPDRTQRIEETIQTRATAARQQVGVQAKRHTMAIHRHRADIALAKDRRALEAELAAGGDAEKSLIS
jgi:hypothetical protein